MFRTPSDDFGIGSGTVAQRFLSLPQALQERGCCYTIAWQRRGDVIIPTSMRGESEFLRENRSFAFLPKQGYVGRILAEEGSIDSEVISDMLSVDPRSFLRKSAALLNGVSSVLFLFEHQGDGMLLELGFTCPNDAQKSLQVLRTSHAPLLKQVALGSRRFGQASQADDLIIFSSREKNKEAVVCRTRSPSPERAQSWWPSVGSTGHPLCCGLPCKYFRKKGCKDGPQCKRCHLCIFTKSCEKKRILSLRSLGDSVPFSGESSGESSAGR